MARLAQTVLDLDQDIADVDEAITDGFTTHPLADIVTSLSGVGVLLGAQFLAATGGGLADYASADHLAGYAGLAPAPKDSGQRSGNMHRPRRYNRQLQKVFYLSALVSLQRDSASRAYYDRKRAEGKTHRQAVLALARRRVNVLWAMIRDRRTYHLPTTDSSAVA